MLKGFPLSAGKKLPPQNASLRCENTFTMQMLRGILRAALGHGAGTPTKRVHLYSIRLQAVCKDLILYFRHIFQQYGEYASLFFAAGHQPACGGHFNKPVSIVFAGILKKVWRKCGNSTQSVNLML